MYCRQCGAELSDDSRFCSKCGAPQQEGLAPPAQLGMIYSPYANPQCQIRIEFLIPETERANEVRFWIDGNLVTGLYTGITQFSIRTTPGEHEVKFVSSPRTMLTRRKIAQGTQRLSFSFNDTVQIIRNGDIFEFSGAASYRCQTEPGDPSYI